MAIPGDARVQSDAFTLTVTIPAESGPLHGWSIEQLKIPGRYVTVNSIFFIAWLNISISRVGRLHVRFISNARIIIETCNVRSFQLSTSVLKNSCASYELYVDDSVLIIAQVDNVARFYTFEPGKWQVSDHYADCTPWLMGGIVDNRSLDNYEPTEPCSDYSNLHSSYHSTGRQRDDCTEPVCSFTHRA